jgi:hypothetical protein
MKKYRRDIRIGIKPMKIALFTPLLFACVGTAVFAAPITPEEVLTEVYARNPELASSAARVKAEYAAISSKYSLSNPRVGIMRQ